ncbi:hypothetical protein [Sorangium sp. So ce1335]|uniref:hypothetical protein n=1 Tax=Sorangium sp. So ce1335 TaxID=3133335 RepID=UPI003F620F5E
MRSIHFVGTVSMALMLGATAFVAGCGDDSGEDTSGGTTASSTTSSSSTTGAGTGGGGGEDTGGEGGGGGGEDADCVSCSAPLLLGADSADLCESSVPKYVALTDCICEACGAAEGDPCYNVCSEEGGERSAECTTCGEMAATTAEGECAAEGTTCLQDMPE